MWRTAGKRASACVRHFYTHSTHSKRPNLVINEALNWVGGRQVAPREIEGNFQVLDPATGDAICECPGSGKTDVDDAVATAKTALKQWSETPGVERGVILQKAASIIRKRVEQIADIETRNCGKPIWEARVDIQAGADCLSYMAGHAAITAQIGQSVTLPNGSFGIVRREPLGVCAGIGVWNFPFLTVSWKAAPALACGNTMIFKPSPLTPLTAIILAEILEEAGLPKGVFNILQGLGPTGERLCEHPDIAKVSFTGSVKVGKRVMKNCAEGIKNVTLELGGKSPLIIFDDTDLDTAITGTMNANFLSQGQVCTAATRVYVQRRMLDSFLERLTLETERLRIGDPLDEATKVGATISKKQLDKITGFVDRALDEGAECVTGGKPFVPSDPHLENGFYFQPTILTNCRDNMEIVNKEVFGAVMTILPFETEEEVLTRANFTPYGLAGGVFTRDIKRAHRVAHHLQAGGICINNYNIYPPEVPFGGYKMSGIGRENGCAAIDQYTQLKTIYVEMGPIEGHFTHQD